MKIVGKVHTLGHKMEGENAAGFWSYRTLVVETIDGGSKPRKVAINFFGDRRIGKLNALQVGDIVEVVFELSSREWEGRWFTDVQGYAVTQYQRASSELVPREAVEAQEPPKVVEEITAPTVVELPENDPPF